MQTRLRLLLLALFVAFPLCATSLADESASTPRSDQLINTDWKFIREDAPGADQPTFNDAAWQSVSLPHTWNNLDGQDGGNNYYRGPAWYRRHLQLQNNSGKSLFLKFDAASSAAELYVNGKHVGSHKGMFSAFCFDITPYVNFSADNIIAIRVTNEKDDSIPPITADFTFFGGLYRGVHLLTLSPLSVTPLDDASSGVYIKQAKVTPDQADLEITTKLRNAGPEKSAAVTAQLLDATGKAVGEYHASINVPTSGTADLIIPIQLAHPHLWNAKKDPYLYHAVITVNDGNTLADKISEPIGIRFFHVDPDKGFFLNGQSYPLHGVNRHQDRLDKGWAIGSAEQQEDFNLIMEMGCSAIRLAHYQHAQEFYDLCDKGGLVVWAEACLVNSVVPSKAFDDVAKQQLRELIKQSYNHPSICFWSLFNELGQGKVSADELADQNRHQIELVTQLNELAHQLDPTRLTTGASNRGQPTYPLHTITDVIAFNRYDGWYTRKNSDWPADLDALHKALPNTGVGISEYGAGASIADHEPNPHPPKTAGHWHPEEYQCLVHEAAYDAMRERHWLWGTFLWNMFDFAADQRNEGDHPGRNDKGLVTYDRKTKKDAFFFYKANWSDDPFVYITERRFTVRKQPTQTIKVYSNCDSVELKLNGTSIGSVKNENHIFLWPNVEFRSGQNTLEAIGEKSGKQFSDSYQLSLDPKSQTGPATQPATEP